MGGFHRRSRLMPPVRGANHSFGRPNGNERNTVGERVSTSVDLAKRSRGAIFGRGEDYDVDMATVDLPERGATSREPRKHEPDQPPGRA